ncbi:PREDICTED: integrator complex subunit 1-like, partial [Rhinopithecus bieti]|uniref:integrator complex subunit 1-like n=1 Tax=Rhinopithecus bieti TaxID=61621 RepID=UPI00083BE3F6
MMLGITAQVKEAGIAWDKGEKRNLEVLRSFQNQIAAIQRDAVWWLHTVVPSISKLAPRTTCTACTRCCSQSNRRPTTSGTTGHQRVTA